MPELVRSVVSRVRTYFKDRRQSPRLRVRLLFTVGIHRTGNGHNSPRRAQGLMGHTRDISCNGLGLLLPQIHVDGHHLTAEGRELELRLEMGNNDPISMLVLPRRYERLEDAELGCMYLIGARIVSIDEADRTRYLSFISEGLQNRPA
ncbi:MAG: PilZ domain-containing protein [Pyrinomonadaceae bacterium]